MGMSASRDTLPYELFAAGKTVTKAFAMCFKHKGGVLSLGGVDTRLHKTRMEFVRAHILSSGWYQVKLLDILLVSEKEESGHKALDGRAQGDAVSLGEEHVKRLNIGKGVIVDSGTTDTYLPRYLKTRFESIFEAMSTAAYSTTRMNLTPTQRRRLPAILLKLQGQDGDTVTIHVPSSAYIENLGKNTYIGRLFLTEGSGAVLGANVMSNHDVVFDPENKRVSERNIL